MQFLLHGKLESAVGEALVRQGHRVDLMPEISFTMNERSLIYEEHRCAGPPSRGPTIALPHISVRGEVN
jgi:hypothetical protein